MRPSITAERGIVVGIAVALTLQAVNGYFAYRAATDYVQAAQDRRASLNILQHSEGYLSLLKDAETGQRGFVLTADPSYLDPYKKAVAGLSESRSKFYDSARDEYPDVLTEVDRHTNKLMAELGETIDLQLNDPVAGQAAAQELVRGGAGKHSMDELRRIISDLKAAKQLKPEIQRLRHDMCARS